MTTKDRDRLREILKQIHKLRHEETIKAQELKQKLKEEMQAREDSGHARVIITAMTREKRRAGVKSPDKLVKCVDCLKWVPDMEEHIKKEHIVEYAEKIAALEVVEEIEKPKEELPKKTKKEVPKVEAIPEPEIDPKEEEIARLKALLAEKEKALQE